jgi:uncharacterized protein (TIGR03118 family)
MNGFHCNFLTRFLSACCLCCTFAAGGAEAAPPNHDDYQQHNLVSDGTVPADHTDSNLVNAWGIALNPNSPMWVANNGTGTSTLYDGDGNARSLVVILPPSDEGSGNPTGIVSNNTSDFTISNNGSTGIARFIFADESGRISAWAPNVDATHALIQADNSGSGAIYKGITLGANGTGNFLYATDFHNAKVDVFDKAYAPVTLSDDAFMDPQIPTGFAPFGIQNLQGNIYVTYAKQDDAGEDDVHGHGLGFVDVFDADGRLLRRVAARGALNAPWGLAMAPADFGRLSNRLLVGNFGDGKINAYDMADGKWVGGLQKAHGGPLVIEGLWGIAFGNGILNQPVNTLFFSAGPEDEEHGLYGRIDVESHSPGMHL